MPGIANSIRFDVKIDGVDIGSFTGLDGLSAEYEMQTYEEGGQNGFVHQLPGRLKYTNIKLTRPVDGSSRCLAAWFGSLGNGGGVTRRTATIVAYDDNHDVVAEWSLVDVCPVRYNGPSFSTDGAKAASETLELAHHGFRT